MRFRDRIEVDNKLPKFSPQGPAVRVDQFSERIKGIRRTTLRPQGITANNEDLVLNRASIQQCPPRLIALCRPPCGDEKNPDPLLCQRSSEFRKAEVVADHNTSPCTHSAGTHNERSNRATGDKVQRVTGRLEEMDLVVAVEKMTRLVHETRICVMAGWIFDKRTSGDDNRRKSHRSSDKISNEWITGAVRPGSMFQSGIAAVEQFGKNKDIKRGKFLCVAR